MYNFFMYLRLFFMILFYKPGADDSKCPATYSCISANDCSLQHFNSISLTNLTQCAKSTKVCCPPPLNSSNSDPKIKSYEPPETENFLSHPNARLLPLESCGFGNPPPRIGNGQQARISEAGDHEFPWMALLGIKSQNRSGASKEDFNCGGTVINRRYVLTAAHCLPKGDPINFVRLNEHNITLNPECQSNPNGDPICNYYEDFPIENFTVHPEYNATTSKNDIALIRLSKEVNETNNMPICLPLDLSEVNLTDSAIYETAGWGTTEDKIRSDVLRKINVTKVNTNECNVCQDLIKYPFCPLSEEAHLCVGGLQLWNDVCVGDSGGPLMYHRTSLPLATYQLGITSFKSHDSCGDVQFRHNIFVNVPHYIKWILDTIRE